MTTRVSGLGILILGVMGGACGDDAPRHLDAGNTGSHSFVEDFVDTSHVDTAASTATVDTAGTGFARATPPVMMRSTGTGADGAATLTGGTYPAGTHNLTSFANTTSALTIDGDTTLLVTGDFTVSSGGAINVNGNLTLVVGGTLSVDCSIITVSGNLLIQHPDSATPIRMGCTGGGGLEGTFKTANLADAAKTTGSVEVDTRGPIVMTHAGYFFSGRNTAGASGDVTVRAYGDIGLDNTSYIFANDATAPGTTGVTTVMTEGKLSLATSSYIMAGRGSVGGGVKLRVGGDMSIEGSSWVLTPSSSGSSIDAIVEGAVTMTNDGYFSVQAGSDRTPALTLVAGSLHATNGYFTSPGGSSTMRGGALTIRVKGDLTLDGSAYVASGTVPCMPGNDLVLEAGGAISVTGDADGNAGNSVDGTSCTKMAGGNVVIRAGGTLTVNSTSVPAFSTGTGATMGTDTEMGMAAVSVTPDAKLKTILVVQSSALPLEAGGGSITGSMLTADPGVTLLVAPDGTTFAPAATLAGTALTAAWKYRVELGARLFDGAAADKLEVDY